MNLNVWEQLVALLIFADIDDLNHLTVDPTFLLESNRDFEDNEDDRAEKEAFI